MFRGITLATLTAATLLAGVHGASAIVIINGGGENGYSTQGYSTQGTGEQGVATHGAIATGVTVIAIEMLRAQ